MRRLILTASILTLTLAAACGAPKNNNSADARTGASWSLAAGQSGMTYVTIKNNLLGEVNTFRDISGTVSVKGDALINIDLNSVDTNNEIRDGRMKEFLFETQLHQVAKISTKLDMTPYENLTVGQSRTELLELVINLHGVEIEQEAYVLVTRLSPNNVGVATKAPLLLDAEDFGLEAGLAKLQELAKLDSITPVVPVTVSFVFER